MLSHLTKEKAKMGKIMIICHKRLSLVRSWLCEPVRTRTSSCCIFIFSLPLLMTSIAAIITTPQALGAETHSLKDFLRNCHISPMNKLPIMNVLQPQNNVICPDPIRLHQCNYTDANCNTLLFAHRIKGQCPALRV